MSKDIGKHFVQEFVIGLGLLSGLGVDPEGEILKALNQSIQTLNPSMNFTGLIIFFSIITTILSMIGAFALGGWTGIIAVLLAFLGGIFINSQIGIWLIVTAILLGLFAPNIKNFSD